ncbi:MAG: hypothetical protein L0I24_22780 [Pseudonocardia sp.]|nr:hypothetical protein [Pseudonocardia sp.]
MNLEVYNASGPDGVRLSPGGTLKRDNTDVRFSPVAGPVVLWLTNVVPRGDGKYHAGIGEVRLLGVSKTPQ